MNAHEPNSERIINRNGYVDTQFLFDFMNDSQTSHNLRTSQVEVINLDGSKVNVPTPNNVIPFPDRLLPCAA